MKRIPFSYIAITVLLFLCCHKKEDIPPTIIQGKITDIKSGVPIDKAYVYCYGNTGPINQQSFKDFSTYSNANGNYTLSIPVDFSFTLESVQKQDYLNNLFPLEGHNINLGDTNLVNIQLLPKDGFMRLQINNTSGQYDSIYIKIASPAAMSEGLGPQKLSQFPLMLEPGEIYTETISLPSNENVEMYWGFTLFSSTNSMFNASVFIPYNDTTDYLIEY